MKKIILSFVMLFALASTASAQDTLYLHGTLFNNYLYDGDFLPFTYYVGFPPSYLGGCGYLEGGSIEHAKKFVIEDSLRHVTVYGNMLTVCDLDTAKQWRAHVRAYCDTSKQETDWSPWIEAGYTTPYNPVGVGSPSDLSRFTSVMPNPATKSATVTSCFGMRRVEVYNMRGMLVYIEGTPQYTTKRIDLTGWAPGQYIVMIETPAGKTAKRLTVVR